MTFRSNRLTPLLGVALLALPFLNCGKGSSEPPPAGSTSQPGAAAPFTYNQVASGLSSPSGIALGNANTLVVSQAPTAPQDASIAKINLGTGEVNLQGAGPDVHARFAANHAGRLYWVDTTTGALLTQGGSDQAPSTLYAGGLQPATAVAVDSADRVYIAGAGSPASGGAAVMVLGGSMTSIPDPAGPEKTVLAAGPSGDLYWTSHSAGLIYHRAPDGTGSAILSGLNAPLGLALDAGGTILYFTEVPTPGVAGSAGGKNTVNALDLSTGTRTVIHSGDPQPTAVAVAPNGNVYWTSTSQGVVMQAVPAPAASVAAQFTAALSGAQEVPPVTTSVTGQAAFNLVTATTRSDDHVSTGPALTYRVSIGRINNVRRIEIHQGAMGVTGPLVATLSRGEDFGEDDSRSGFAVSGRIRPGSLKGPFLNDWAGFTAALSAGNLYLNVMTQANPTGQVRGQILVASGTTSNHPPTASITTPSGSVTIQAGQSVSFAGTASDPDGNPVTVIWSFGDGATSALLAPGSHAYPAAGTFTVRLTATDSNGLVDPNPPTRTITVQAATLNLPPAGTITAPTGNVTITAGQPVSFTGTTSDPNGDPVTVLWVFGDGGTSTMLAPGNHVFTTAGIYTVRMTATDSHGLADPNPPTRTISVAGAAVNQPPTATITTPAANVTIAAGQAVNFAGTASDPNADPVTVAWTFGDGGTSTLLAPGNHTYATAGTYTVTLTATDSKGLKDPAPPTRVVTVTTVGTVATLTQIQTAVFTPLCTSCHAAGGSAGLNVAAGKAYANLVNVPATTLSGMRVVPGSPSTSALVTQLAGGHHNVSAANQALISAWITAGALNN